MPVSLPPEKHT